MNFFGHATVACWRMTHPAFVLGAMLPDFERMSGARGPIVEHDGVREGVRWHHRTDAAFHACPTFLASCRAARERLGAHGLARGARMAIAHVGIELLLDGLLLGDPKVEDAYLEALRAAIGLEASLLWHSRAEARRFEHLVGRLLDAGIPVAYRDARTVAERIHRITAFRSRIAFEPQQVPLVAAWAETTRVEIADRLPVLLDELRSRMPGAGC